VEEIRNFKMKLINLLKTDNLKVFSQTYSESLLKINMIVTRVAELKHLHKSVRLKGSLFSKKFERKFYKESL